MIIESGYVDELVEQAKQDWGLQDYRIDWAYGECEAEGDIEMRETEHCGFITLDPDKIPNREILTRTIYHEVGHFVVAPIARGISDWMMYLLPDEKMQAIYEESVNTRENEVIDWIIVKVFKL